MIIAIASQKGGSGKTTTTLCIGDCLHLRGEAVTLVDADPQGSLSTITNIGREAGENLPKVLAVDPADLTLVGQRSEDVVLIDCPGFKDRTSRAALATADVVLMPVRPSVLDLAAAGNTLALIENARTINKDLRLAIVITQADPRSSMAAEAREALEQLDAYVMEGVIAQRTEYQRAAGAGVGVVGYDKRSKAAKEIEALTTELLAFMREG